MSWWTEERRAELRALWAQQDPGLSAAEIAARMGTTKNAVVGQAHRLGLPGRESPIRRVEGAAALRAAKAVQPKPQRAPAEAARSPRAVPPKPAAARILARRPQGTRHDACQFPIGEPREPGFRFCAAATREGSSYCAEHHALCWRPFQPKAAA